MELNFDELDQRLRRSSAPVDASELHGAISGHLCAPLGDIDSCIKYALDGVAQEQAKVLKSDIETMSATVARQLHLGAMDFMPLLPDDERPLAERTGALAEWCEGFLFGFGVSGVQGLNALPASVQEALRDFIEIGRVGSPAGEDEADEEAYGELVEYLRVAVQLIHDELNDKRTEKS